MTTNIDLGILSGISYVSGIDYFKGINERVLENTPISHVMSPNPSIVLVSVDCDQYVQYLFDKEYDRVANHILAGVHKLVSAGCNTLVIASNTGHIAVPAIERVYPSLRILHIADCCGHYLKSKGYTNVGLIGTKPTMEEDYLKDRLALHGIQTMVPETNAARSEVYRIIIEELSYNKFFDESRQRLVEIVGSLRERGAQACIMGCTEIELILSSSDVSDIELVPSAQIHIQSIADVILGSLAIEEVLPPS